MMIIIVDDYIEFHSSQVKYTLLYFQKPVHFMKERHFGPVCVNFRISEGWSENKKIYKIII
jgi:hypothetical protein